MRLPSVNCVLLACIATTLAIGTKETMRNKRDLQFWKSLIAAKLGLTEIKPSVQNEEAKIIRMPALENVIVRAIPKVTLVEAPVPVPETIVPMDPTMTILQSFLQTKTQEQTLMALQGIKDIMQSGILKARQDVMMVPPQPPIIMMPQMLQERLVYPPPQPIMMPEYHRYPIYPVLPRIQVPEFPPMPLVPRPVIQAPILPPIPVLPPPPPPPMPVVPEFVVPKIKPLPVPPMFPVPVEPSSYLYRQMKHNESMMSFISEHGGDVIVKKTNKPMPPLPPYIIDRFQKIIFGLPLGTPVSALPKLLSLPKFNPSGQLTDIEYGPIPYPTFVPGSPIITEPSNVHVEVDGNSNKNIQEGHINIFAGGKVVKKPIGSTLVHEEIIVPKPLVVDVPMGRVVLPPPPSIVEKVNVAEGHQFSYKQLHGDGSISSYIGTGEIREPSSPVIVQDISKLPPPPPYIVDRISDVVDKAHKPKSMWGYAFKIANGIGSYESGKNNKIFYSRLEPGSPKPGLSVFPDPLSSKNDNEPKKPNKNVYYVGNDKDEFGNPFISTKIDEKSSVSSNELSESDLDKQRETNSKFKPIKKIPPLPMPIAGENEKLALKEAGGVKYSYTLQKNDGDSLKFGGNPEYPDEKLSNKSEGLESSVFKNFKDEEKFGKYAYKLTNSNGDYTTFSKGSGPVSVEKGVGKFPVLPPTVVDVAQPIPVIPTVVKVGEKHPGAVMFTEPVLSNYIYKQISHNNPQPFTVVKIEDKSRIELPKGEVTVKVNRHDHISKNGTKYFCNKVHPLPIPNVPISVIPAAPKPVNPVGVDHEHTRKDGSKYPCREVHLVPGITAAPIPAIPSAHVVATVPSELVYVPSLKVQAPPPTLQKFKVQNAESHFSYTQIKSQVSSTTPKADTNTTKVLSLSQNPIVVVESENEGSKYSFTQNKSDGSSMKVEGNKDNTVSVNIEEAKEKSSDSRRGDIPDALS